MWRYASFPSSISPSKYCFRNKIIDILPDCKLKYSLICKEFRLYKKGTYQAKNRRSHPNESEGAQFPKVGNFILILGVSLRRRRSTMLNPRLLAWGLVLSRTQCLGEALLCLASGRDSGEKLFFIRRLRPQYGMAVYSEAHPGTSKKRIAHQRFPFTS